MAGRARLLADGDEIERAPARPASSSAAAGGDQPELALLDRERGDDLDPRARAALVAEQRARLLGRPQVAVDDRVGEVDATHPSTPASDRSARRTSSRLAPHGTVIRAPVALDAALAQAALEQGRLRPGLAFVQQRAEVDPRVRVVAVERRVDLARALAADQRPLGGLRRPGVEEVDGRVELQPGAAAREQVVVGRVGGGELAEVDRHEVQLQRGQVLVVFDHGLRHVEQLRRVRRHDLDDPDPRRRRRVDEVDVLVAALDHVHERVAPARLRGAGELARVARVDRVVDDERDLLRRASSHASRTPTRISSPSSRSSWTSARSSPSDGDDELRPPVDPARAHVREQRLRLQRRRILDAHAPIRPGDEVRLDHAAAAIPHRIAAPEDDPHVDSARARRRAASDVPGPYRRAAPRRRARRARRARAHRRYASPSGEQRAGRARPGRPCRVAPGGVAREDVVARGREALAAAGQGEDGAGEVAAAQRGEAGRKVARRRRHLRERRRQRVAPSGRKRTQSCSGCGRGS